MYIGRAAHKQPGIQERNCSLFSSLFQYCDLVQTVASLRTSLADNAAKYWLRAATLRGVGEDRKLIQAVGSPVSFKPGMVSAVFVNFCDNFSCVPWFQIGYKFQWPVVWNVLQEWRLLNSIEEAEAFGSAPEFKEVTHRPSAAAFQFAENATISRKKFPPSKAVKDGLNKWVTSKVFMSQLAFGICRSDAALAWVGWPQQLPLPPESELASLWRVAHEEFRV